MSINLGDLRTAVINYVDTIVGVSVSPLHPSTGLEIGPNEEFTFTVSAYNPGLPDGVRLRNVVWRVRMDDNTVGKLYVPPAPIVARTYLTTGSPQLAAGSLVDEMYLFPQDSYLDVRETQQINLKGKALSYVPGATCYIRFKIYADVDLGWLFPAWQDSSLAIRQLIVRG